MAVIKEGIIISTDGKISFGDYTAAAKLKAVAEHNGDEYSVKTHKDVTRLEKNSALLVETVPGASVADFTHTESGMAFTAFGKGNTQITLELLPDTEYELKTNDSSHGMIKTNLSGKLIFGEELSGEGTAVTVERCV